MITLLKGFTFFNGMFKIDLPVLEMASPRSISALLLSALFITTCSAILPSVHYFDPRVYVNCTDNTECIVGCVCLWSKCRSTAGMKIIEGLRSKCRKCFSDKDCPRFTSGDICTDVGICKTCLDKHLKVMEHPCTPKSRFTPKTTQRICKNDLGCKNGCTCITEDDVNLCEDRSVYNITLGACKSCRYDSECAGTCDAKTKKCFLCRAAAKDDAIRACHRAEATAANISPPSNSKANNSTVPNYGTNITSLNDSKPTNSSEENLAQETNTPIGNTADGNTATPNPQPTVCIDTSWLQERSLEHATIRHAGLANVFCIPDLPCGTGGHILRRCTTKGTKCHLVTYREVCQIRGDCIESATAVSQLSHTYDWSQFKVDTNSEGGTLELTSLSAHPQSVPSSPSRIIARIGDQLNSMGLGSICNAVALFPHGLRGTFARDMVETRCVVQLF